LIVPPPGCKPSASGDLQRRVLPAQPKTSTIAGTRWRAVVMYPCMRVSNRPATLGPLPRHAAAATAGPRTGAERTSYVRTGPEGQRGIRGDSAGGARIVQGVKRCVSW
jgi:hypothetical protein